MNHKGTQRLATERLILRRFSIDDAGAAFRNWCSDPDVTHFLTWPPHRNIGETLKVLELWVPRYDESNYYNWAIELAGELVGNINIVQQREDIESVHVGYCMGKAWWGRGVMSEALAELIRFFFEEIGAKRMDSRHDTRNPASGRVMQKCGMIHEGTMRRADVNNLGICDCDHYAILADDYFAQKMMKFGFYAK